MIFVLLSDQFSFFVRVFPVRFFALKGLYMQSPGLPRSGYPGCREGTRQPQRGCVQDSIPGNSRTQPRWGCTPWCPVTQGSRCAATLGSAYAAPAGQKIHAKPNRYHYFNFGCGPGRARIFVDGFSILWALHAAPRTKKPQGASDAPRGFYTLTKLGVGSVLGFASLSPTPCFSNNHRSRVDRILLVCRHYRHSSPYKTGNRKCNLGKMTGRFRRPMTRGHTW
uniref:Uncharacterized protein n=1 Tax=Candidatus Kentrum sp. UNK TaxID=2126344 RepID=A0A451ALM8_9GAMM|nr:MAG: hypothetical protein BECKUNK1418G_GA0071005_11176 [Candidatus Kentron sp. UNK]VFK71098.1 MAG: hypothetical protein BECKUNK1418H_GA0071006_105018 [Candidatus Kentron sp. UNK]